LAKYYWAAGWPITLAGTLPQSYVFVSIRHIPSEARFSHYAKIKVAISPLFLVNVRLLLNNIHILELLYFGPGVYVRPSNCWAIAYVALGQKCLKTPDLKQLRPHVS